MKKLFLLLALFGLMFSACTEGGEDDGNGNKTEQPSGNPDDPNNPGGGNDNPADQNNPGGGVDILADKTEAIHFQDKTTKLICPLHWDKNEDEELSYEEAAAVTDLGTAFKGSSIWVFTELKYFTSLKRIADSAFEGCVNLVKVTLPQQITAIGTSVFSGCYNLKKIAIPDSVTLIEGGAFSGCSSLTSVTIPDSVTYIRNYAFRDCRSLTSVTIGDSVTSIGKYAF